VPLLGDDLLWTLESAIALAVAEEAEEDAAAAAAAVAEAFRLVW
jgi:hypothetical protein